MDVVGLVGSLAFAVVSLPILLESLRKHTSKNISVPYLVLTLVGNIFTFTFVIYTTITTGVFLLPLYVNYVSAITITLILVGIKWKMRN